MTPTPASVLKDTFGYNSFRPLQQEVIANVLAGRDTLAIMPTGGGKSICYQIPSILLPGLTVVVSPLISLMKDQVEQLHANGVPAVFLNSSLTPDVYLANMESIRRKEVKLLYVAPETLLTPRIFSLLDTVGVDLFTIDEAHCISEWGHDFRPEYRQLVEARRRYPKAVCLALTATATPRVRKDIQASLGFSASNEFVASFNRENLFIEVQWKEDAFRQTLQFLNKYKDQSGIIYCFSRKQVDELTLQLAAKGFSVVAYHAGLDDLTRRKNQELFIRDDAQIVVATIAFGMGINKPNVRFVLHHDLPKSIEGYYQEIGRAGRDGLPAHCLLLYNSGDAVKQSIFFKDKKGLELQVAKDHLDQMVKYAECTDKCRRIPLLQYFGEAITSTRCDNCDHCQPQPASTAVDITLPAQKFLSCVLRTGERFGTGHIIDVLRGSKKEQVLKWEHDKLSTYGIGNDLSVDEWNKIARQLLKMGYLEVEGEYHTLVCTDKARRDLKSRAKILGSKVTVIQKTTDEETPSGVDYNRALYSLLREKRKQMADEIHVPPYVIFSDKTLVEMAACYPQSRAALLNISGVGQTKLKDYGDAFLDILRPFCDKHHLQERRLESTTGSKKANPSGSKYMTYGAAYQSGKSLDDLMQQMNVNQATVLDNLGWYLQAGNLLKVREDILMLLTCTPEQQKDAFQAFEELGAERLKPVFEQMNEQLSYDEVKLLRLIYLSRAG
jgi:ATP-dependent DNA helicase RecQ